MLKKRSPVYSQSKLFLTCTADILISESILSGLVHWTMCAHSVDIVQCQTTGVKLPQKRRRRNFK